MINCVKTVARSALQKGWLCFVVSCFLVCGLSSFAQLRAQVAEAHAAERVHDALRSLKEIVLKASQVRPGVMRALHRGEEEKANEDYLYEEDAHLLDIMQDAEAMDELHAALFERYPFLAGKGLRDLDVMAFYLFFNVWDHLSDADFDNILSSMKMLKWDGYPEKLEGRSVLTRESAKTLSTRRSHLESFIFDLTYKLHSGGYFSYSNYYTNIPEKHVMLYVFFSDIMGFDVYLPGILKDDVEQRISQLISSAERLKLQSLLQRELVYFSYRWPLLFDASFALPSRLSLDQLKIAFDVLVQHGPLQLMKRLRSARRVSQNDALRHFQMLAAAGERYRGKGRDPELAYRSIFSQKLISQAAELEIERPEDFLMHVYLVQLLNLQDITKSDLIRIYEGATQQKLQKTQELLLQEIKREASSPYYERYTQRFKNRR